MRKMFLLIIMLLLPTLTYATCNITLEPNEISFINTNQQTLTVTNNDLVEREITVTSKPPISLPDGSGLITIPNPVFILQSNTFMDVSIATGENLATTPLYALIQVYAKDCGYGYVHTSIINDKVTNPPVTVKSLVDVMNTTVINPTTIEKPAFLDGIKFIPKTFTFRVSFLYVALVITLLVLGILLFFEFFRVLWRVIIGLIISFFINYAIYTLFLAR